jgi:hypothetical protein
MACTSDITDEEIQIDRTIKEGYEPCHNCRHGVMDLVEVTTNFSILELPIWKLSSNQQALHCTRCRYTVPFIELKNHCEDEHDTIQITQSIPPSTSFGDVPPEIPQSPSRSISTSVDDTNNNNDDIVSTQEVKAEEIVIIAEPDDTQLPDLNDSSLSTSSNCDITVTSSQLGSTEIVSTKSYSPSVVDLGKEEKVDETDIIMKSSSLRSPLQACYYNLIVITDEDELLLAQQEQQKKLIAEMVMDEQEEQKESNSIKEVKNVVEEKTGHNEKNAIIIDDIPEEVIDLVTPKGIMVEVIPVIDEEELESTISLSSTKQSSYLPNSIDLSQYGLSSWKVFSI